MKKTFKPKLTVFPIRTIKAKRGDVFIPKKDLKTGLGFTPVSKVVYKPSRLEIFIYNVKSFFKKVFKPEILEIEKEDGSWDKINVTGLNTYNHKDGIWIRGFGFARYNEKPTKKKIKYIKFNLKKGEVETIYKS